MPITSSAKKALRASKHKKVFNIRRNKEMEDAIKTVKKLVVNKDKKGAEKALVTAYKKIDKTAKSKYIKKNNASRKKSRLAKMVGKIA